MNRIPTAHSQVRQARTAPSLLSLSLLLTLTLALLASGCGEKKKDAQDKPSAETADPAKPDQPAPTPATKPKPLPEPPPLAADPGEHQGKALWLRGFGDVGKDAPRDVAIDASGRVAVTGYFSGSVDFGDGAARPAKAVDAFVTVYEADGSHAWTVHFGGEGEDAGNAVAFAPDGGVVIAGLFSGAVLIGDTALAAVGSDDAFVVRLDKDGKVVWARQIGGIDSDGAHGVTLTDKGSVVVTGSYRRKMQVGSQTLEAKGGEDMFLVQLTPSGDLDWIHSYGSLYKDIGQRVAIDVQGSVIALGIFHDKVSFGGDTLESVGNQDVVVVKLDPAGEHIWSHRYGSPFNELALGLAVDPAGGIAITGSFDQECTFGDAALTSAGESDVFAVKLDTAGEVQWAHRFGGAREDIGHGIAADRYGNLLLTGWFWGSVDFGGGPLQAQGGNKDAFLVKLSAKGEHLWSKRFGSQDHDQGRAVAMTPEGRSALAGVYRFGLTMAGTTLQSARKPGEKAPFADGFVASFER